MHIFLTVQYYTVYILVYRYTFIDYTLPVGLDVSQWITKAGRKIESEIF
jgi:hypothetical protein